MPLILNIVKAPKSVAASETSKTIGQEGGSLGRGDDNVWVLEDPERYLSGHHCRFSYDNGQYYLTDLSTNGTFLNGAADPMGKGSKAAVKDQDRFTVGDYEFSIQLQADDVAPVVVDSLAASPFDDALAADAPAFGSSPFASIPNESADALVGGAAETDPLQALDRASSKRDSPLVGDNTAPVSDPFSMPTQADHGDPLNQQVDWPEPVSQPGPSAPGNGQPAVIPDDWDDDSLSSNSAPAEPIPPPPPSPPQAAPEALANAELVDQNARLQAQVEQLTGQIKDLQSQLEQQQQAAVIEGGVDHTLIRALGLDGGNLSDADIVRINRQGGEAIRETVRGLMQVLGSRSAIKNEFRMNVTTIQPVENNPLKFSANIDDALDNMFVKQSKAYKQPVEAVQASFEDIAEHQMAVLAGIREAFRALVDRFDPVRLEERFSRQQKGGLMIGSQKARNWEAYTDYFNELAGDIDKSFQYLFGDGFVRAYEDQLQKLAISRKSKQHVKQTKK